MSGAGKFSNFAAELRKSYRDMKWMYVCWVTWLLCMPAPVWSRNEVEVILQTNDGIISGRLRSEDNAPVDFATVYLKGTQYGCTSNEKGTFRLMAPAGR